jgi:hypothetical protein
LWWWNLTDLLSATNEKTMPCGHAWSFLSMPRDGQLAGSRPFDD